MKLSKKEKGEFMVTYEHDGNGNVYYEAEAGVVWVCEGIIANAQGVVDILNDAQQKIKAAQNSEGTTERNQLEEN